MTKLEANELNNAIQAAKLNKEYIGYAARSISALIRSTKTTANKNLMIIKAAAIPAIIQHGDFIV